MACDILLYSNICSHILDIICAVYKKKKLFGSVFENWERRCIKGSAVCCKGKIHGGWASYILLSLRSEESFIQGRCDQFV
jgi:hypothetical protein